MRYSRIEYVESKLDDTINNFKEAMTKLDLKHDESIKSLKESLKESEARLEADRKATEARLKADREASEARLKADREEFNIRFAQERREWRETKRWLYINFGGVVAILITIAIAIIGFIITNGAPPA